MKDVIGTLQTIRGLREKRRAREERARHAQYRESELAVAAAKEAVEEFETLRMERTLEIHNALLGKTLRLRDVDWFRFELDRLKREEADLAAELEGRREKRQVAEENHLKAREVHQESIRQLSKFEALSEEAEKDRRKVEILANDAKEEDALEALINRPGGRP